MRLSREEVEVNVLNEVFIIHYSLPKPVEKILIANFCCHQAYLRWQIQQQLLFAVTNFEG